MGPVARNIIKITEIYLDFPRFSYNNVFIVLLNYIQYLLDFTRHIDYYSILNKISY